MFWVPVLIITDGFLWHFEQMEKCLHQCPVPAVPVPESCGIQASPGFAMW